LDLVPKGQNQMLMRTSSSAYFYAPHQSYDWVIGLATPIPESRSSFVERYDTASLGRHGTDNGNIGCCMKVKVHKTVHPKLVPNRPND